MSWGPQIGHGIDRGAPGGGAARGTGVADPGRRSSHPRLLAAVLAGLVAFGAWGALTARAQGGPPIPATEGEQFSEVIATVSLPGCLPGSASGVATIVWGDGTGASQGQVTQVSSTQLAVIGSHTYAEEGSDGGTVSGKWQCTPTNPSSGAISGPIDATFDAQVRDAPLSATAQPVTATAGQVFAATVATFTDGDPGGAAADYSATIDWGDGSSSPADGRQVTVSPGSQGFVVSGTHVYADGGSYPLTVTISDAGGYQTTAHGTANVGTATVVPSSVDFTVSPNNVPELSHHALTFSVVSPVPGVAYEWDFGDSSSDQLDGFPGDPFAAPPEATGATVTHTYADPPAALNGVQQATYNVRLRVVPHVGSPNIYAAVAHQVTVVPDTSSGAQFLPVYTSSDGQPSSSEVVTHPVTFIPLTQVPQVINGTPNKIVREDWWFDSNGPPQPPDLTCLSTGQCGHYTGPSPEPLVPDPSQLQPVQGIQDLGPGPVSVLPGACRRYYRGQICNRPETISPTNGFEAFSVNFFDRQLGKIGAPGGYPTLPASGYDTPRAGYPPLSSIDLSKVSGVFWPDYPSGQNPARDAGQRAARDAGQGAAGRVRQAAGAVRPHLIVPGAHSPQVTQETLWDFLYNYATSIEADYPIDQDATGAVYSTQRAWGVTCVSVPNGPGGPPSPPPGGGGGIGTKAIDARAGGAGLRVTAIDARVECHQNEATVERPRMVTMVAYDSGGVASAPATRPVLLTPAGYPNIKLQLGVNGEPSTISGQESFPLHVGDTLRLDPTGSSGGDDAIRYWGVEVGQPRDIVQAYDSSHGTSSWPPASISEQLPETNTYSFSPNCSHGGLATEVPGPPSADVSFSEGGWFGNVPNFSDLLEGASPYHLCGGYVSDTVDPALLPEPVPQAEVQTAGPARDRRAHASRTYRLGTVPGGIQWLGQPTCSSVADPALVTQDSRSLCFTFDHPGIYSVAVAAYNTTGLAAITRIDGFLVLPKINAGDCQVVASSQFKLKVNGAKYTYGWSGSCVAIYHPNPGDAAIYVSHDPIDIDGTTLAPAPGDDIVINNMQPGDAKVFTVAHGACDWQTGAGCGDPGPAAGAVYLQFGQDQVGYEPGFDATEADTLLTPSPTPVAGCDDGDGQTTHEWASQWQLPPGATYQGFAVSQPPCVVFHTDEKSRSDFFITLPPEIAAQQDTHVTLQGEDVPPSSVLTTNSWADVSRARGAKRVIAGAIVPGPRAHKADDIVPTCPANATSSQAVVPGGTQIGPFTLPKELTLCYDSSTGVFIGDVSVSLPFAGASQDIRFGIELGNGQLLRAGGEAQGDVPIASGVDLTQLGFGVQFNPTQVAGTLGLGVGPPGAAILDLDGTVVIASNPFDVKATGVLTLAQLGLQLAKAQAEYNSGADTLTFGITLGNDFGPASLQASLDGGVDFSDWSWYVWGNGQACFGPCLGVQALASHGLLPGAKTMTTTVSACGSILGIGAGFAIQDPGGFSLFGGCDLSGYIPTEFPGHATDTAPFGPGQSETLRLCPATPAVGEPACGSKTVAAVQLYSSAATAPGQEPMAPVVELDGPGGRVIAPTPEPGGHVTEDNNTAFVAEDPIPTDDPLHPGQQVRTTTVFIADPGAASQWTVKVLPGSPAVIGTAVSYSQPPVNASMFSAHVERASITRQGGGLLVRIGNRRFRGGLAHSASGFYAEPILASSIEQPAGTSATAARARSPLARLSLPAIDADRLRGIVFRAPSRLGTDTVTLIDQGGGSTQVLATGIHARQIAGRGLPIAFLPATGHGARHQIEAIILNANGTLRKVLTISSYTAPGLPSPPRPKIDRIVRRGDQLELFFSPGKTPILAGQPTISLKLRSNYGERLSLMIAAGQLRAIGPLHTVGLGREAGEYELVIRGIDPTAAIHVSLVATFDGRHSGAALSLLRPARAGVNEVRLLRLARRRRCPRRGPCRPVIP